MTLFGLSLESFPWIPALRQAKNKAAFSAGSYSNFEYKNLTVSPAQLSGDQLATVAFDISNIGSRAGADVAEIKLGETRRVEVSLNRRAFCYYDVSKHQWTVASGEFDLYIGRSAAEIELTGKVSVQ